jgi:hypothetical protein
MIQLLESIKRSYKQIKKILIDKRKTIIIDKSTIARLICLLRPFKDIIHIVQKGKEPTLHLVTIALLTLRHTLNTHESLIAYSQSYETDSSTHDIDDSDEHIEDDEGMLV